jgi:hypothetical protein
LRIWEQIQRVEEEIGGIGEDLSDHDIPADIKNRLWVA